MTERIMNRMYVGEWSLTLLSQGLKKMVMPNGLFITVLNCRVKTGV